MATSIFEQLINSGIDITELDKLMKESEDPTAEGRKKRKMSVEDILIYDWEQMSEEEKAEAAASVGLPVNEVDNRLREKSVETKMEFQNTDKYKHIQKSAQAIMDEFKGKNLEGNKNWDRDITMFEDAYGKENADKLRELMRPDVDSHVSAPEGSTSTISNIMPSADEINALIDEKAEEKKNNTDLDLTEELKIVDEFDAQQERNQSGSSDIFGDGSPTTEEEGIEVLTDDFADTPLQFIPSPTEGSDEAVSEMLEDLIMGSEAGSGAATVFSDSESSEVTVPSGTIEPLEPVERIYSEDAEYTDETIGGGDHADPFSGTNVDIFTEPTELIEEDFTDEERKEALEKREEQELVDQFIEGNLPESKEKTKVGKFLQKLVGKNKDKKNKRNKKNNKGGSNVPSEDFDNADELTKYYRGGGKIKPFVTYLMGGKAPRYDTGGNVNNDGENGPDLSELNKVHPTVLRHLNEDLFNTVYPSGVMHAPFEGKVGDDEWNKQIDLYNAIMGFPVGTPKSRSQGASTAQGMSPADKPSDKSKEEEGGFDGWEILEDMITGPTEFIWDIGKAISSPFISKVPKIGGKKKK